MTPKKYATDERILQAFERLCRAHGVVSAGFDPGAITAPIDGDVHDGQTRWAIKRAPGSGYMIVAGKGGCGSVFTRWNGYVKKRWDFLMLIEAVAEARLNIYNR